VETAIDGSFWRWRYGSPSGSVWPSTMFTFLPTIKFGPGSVDLIGILVAAKMTAVTNKKYNTLRLVMLTPFNNPFLKFWMCF
jgi:hypothetical protein